MDRHIRRQCTSGYLLQEALSFWHDFIRWKWENEIFF